MRAEAFKDQIDVGVDADFRGDAHRTAHDLLGVERHRHQRAGGGERIIAARADRRRRPEFVRLGLEHVARARQREARPLVGDDEHRLEPAQVPIGAPVLGQFDAGARELAGILVELGLEPFEQREGVGSGAGEACDHVALGETANLAGIGFDDRLAHADLAVAADDDLTALSHHQDGRRMPSGRAGGGLVSHRRSILNFSAQPQASAACMGALRGAQGRRL
jgi:hypothetical protein